jgi:GT2 family glycosyltransferase
MSGTGQTPPQPRIAAVLIGRNEGARLKRCLASVAGVADPVIYVDSGSTDGSPEAARAAGAEVVVLDPTLPFTAARARNAGLAALRARAVPPDHVQFVDGDCELQPGWIATASAFLEAHPQAAIACGRRRERFPDASVYNRLCDREWNTAVGRARSCGGDALMRMAALDTVGGYRDDLIAGEEPEMCVRLRAGGWQVWRLDAEMTLHDAAMTRFAQWWRRSRRGGHAWAEGWALHGAAPERHGVQGTLRALGWGLALPAGSLALALAVGPWGLLPMLAWPAQAVRIAAREGIARRASWEIAIFGVLGKVPEMLGVLGYAAGRIGRRPARLIEYK